MFKRFQVSVIVTLLTFSSSLNAFSIVKDLNNVSSIPSSNMLFNDKIQKLSFEANQSCQSTTTDNDDDQMIKLGHCMLVSQCLGTSGEIIGTCLQGFFQGVCCKASGKKDSKEPDESMTFTTSNDIAGHDVKKDYYTYNTNRNDTVISEINLISSNLNADSNDSSKSKILSPNITSIKSSEINTLVTTILMHVLDELEPGVETMVGLVNKLSQQDIDKTRRENEKMKQDKITSDENIDSNDTIAGGDTNNTDSGGKDVAEEIVANTDDISVTTLPESVTVDAISNTSDYTTSTTSSTTTTTTTTTTTQSWDYKQDCGVRPIRGQGRIVGGTKSMFGDWPWQVLVKESTWLGFFRKNKCGGVLITDRHVITAAHCQPGFLATLYVELGQHDLTGQATYMPKMTAQVKRVILHRDYDAPSFENDIAILELETPIERQPHVVPVCMPEDVISSGAFVGKTAIVTGWGRLTYDGNVPDILQQASVKIISNEECQKKFDKSGHKKNVRDFFLCAGNGRTDSCRGDSGGPLMVQMEDRRWVLAGTVSHGIRCAFPDLPGIYMRMTYYKSWIERVTGRSL